MNDKQCLKEEIGELCSMILLFEKFVEGHRVKVFEEKEMSDDGIWNYLFGGNIKQVGKNELYIFMRKHQSKQSIQDCQLICKRYSHTRDGRLTKQDIWQIFKPKTLKLMSNILRMRKSKNTIPKLLQVRDEIKKQILLILQKTIQYERYAKQMKQNIGKYQQQFKCVTFYNIQAKYLQRYLRQYLNQIKISDCQVLIEHMVGQKINVNKYFYIFFFPQKQYQYSTNPIQKCNLLEQYQPISLDLYSKSKNVWEFGNDYQNHNKPLYLI